MENKFTANDFQNFIRTVNCMSYDEFVKMYNSVFCKPAEYYIKEKFDMCRSSFLNWICNIDAETLEKMMIFCFNK